MKPLPASMLTTATILIALPLLAAPSTNVWNSEASPALPYRYIESTLILRLAPQIENPDIYASNALFLRLYPSINTEQIQPEVTTEPSIVSKTRVLGPNQPRGNLSPSYVQEFAYIDTYKNTRKYEEYFSFPSIRMSLAMPRYGNGFGGGYQPLQFGFGPAAFKFW